MPNQFYGITFGIWQTAKVKGKKSIQRKIWARVWFLVREQQQLDPRLIPFAQEHTARTQLWRYIPRSKMLVEKLNVDRKIREMSDAAISYFFALGIVHSWDTFTRSASILFTELLTKNKQENEKKTTDDPKTRWCSFALGGRSALISP